MNCEFQNIKKDFDDNGFVIVENLLDAVELEKLRAKLDKIPCETDSLALELAQKLFFESQHIRNNPHAFRGLHRSPDAIVSILCLDAMTGAKNGGTESVRGSHKISGEEAARQIWRDVEKGKLASEEIVAAHCPAGSAIFFDTKTLHAAGHNRSPRPGRTIQMEWTGKDSLPVSPVPYAFQGLKPRSRHPASAKQIKVIIYNSHLLTNFASNYSMILGESALYGYSSRKEKTYSSA
mgnify:CR=1 FL=1